MTITIDAVYERGVLKPQKPLPWPEGATLKLTVSEVGQPVDPLTDVIGICEGPADGADQHDRYVLPEQHP